MLEVPTVADGGDVTLGTPPDFTAGIRSEVPKKGASRYAKRGWASGSRKLSKSSEHHEMRAMSVAYRQCAGESLGGTA